MSCSLCTLLVYHIVGLLSFDNFKQVVLISLHGFLSLLHKADQFYDSAILSINWVNKGQHVWILHKLYCSGLSIDLCSQLPFTYHDSDELLDIVALQARLLFNLIKSQSDIHITQAFNLWLLYPFVNSFSQANITISFQLVSEHFDSL